MVLLPPSPPAHGAVGGTRGALLVTTLHCWVQPPPARSFRVILQVARGAELFSPAPRSGRACSSPQLMSGNESPVCRAEDPAPTARPLAGRAPSTIVLHGGSAGSPRTRSASQLMENVSSAALAPLGRTTDACSMGGREGREEPTGKNCLCMLSILTSSKGCGSVGSEHSAGCCFLRAFVLVEPVIHLPSPEQKDRVQREFIARKTFTLCWGGRAQKSSVARGDGHLQLS